MTNGVYKLSEVQAEQLYRIETGFAAFDRLFGSTHFEAKLPLWDEQNQYGIPIGMVTLFSGERGVGKSRVCIWLTSQVTFDDRTCIYFQQEVSIPQFKQWTLPFRHNDDNLLVSDENKVDEQIEIIRKCHPDLVVVDSLNMIDGASSSEEATKVVINKYKDIAKEMHCAVILVSFLTKSGSTKGSSAIEHLVDVCVSVKNLDLAKHEKYNQKHGVGFDPERWRSCFSIGIPKKNRAGETGHCVILKHTNTGLNFMGSDLPNEYD